ncbi:ATP-dependent DNA helicase, partial [Streptomyces sp. DJ]
RHALEQRLAAATAPDTKADGATGTTGADGVGEAAESSPADAAPETAPDATDKALPAAAPQQPETKDTDPVPTTAAAVDAPAPQTEPKQTEPKQTEPKQTEPNASFLRMLEASAADDRTHKTHETVRHRLISDLWDADRQPTSTPVVDISCTTEDSRFLYEVLDAGHSSYADLRAGAVRLLEINHTLPAPADRLHLVLSEPPAEDWAAETVRAVFGVHVLWRTPEGWAGQDVDTALGSRPGGH